MLNLWNSGFSTIDSIHIHNNMPGGNNTSTRPLSKPGQPNPVTRGSGKPVSFIYILLRL